MRTVCGDGIAAEAITTTWPLGLFAKTRVFELEGTLLVYPRRGFACPMSIE